MQSEYRWGIKIGLLVIILVVRQVYKSNNKPKEYAINSTLKVDPVLAEKLQLQPGEQVSLVNRPDTFEVVVKAKGVLDRYEEIGVIEDRELTEKVKSNAARGRVEYASGNEVRLILTY